MTPNVKAYEKITLAAVVSPQTVANVEKFSGVVDLGLHYQAMGIALLGDMAAETIDFRAYRCDADGSNAVLLKSATQLAAFASANDNKQLLINITAEELAASGAQYVKFGLVTGNTGGGPAAVVVLATDARLQPIAQPATVLETVR